MAHSSVPLPHLDKPEKSVIPKKGCDDSDIISWSKFLHRVKLLDS